MGRQKGPCNAAEIAARHRSGRKPRRWKGMLLGELKSAYEDGGAKVADIVHYFGTNRGHLMRLAKRHGWKRRYPERLPEIARRHRNLYRKVQGISGRAVALEALAGLT